MNERIKELAKCNERIENFFVTGPVQRAAIEEFAELIVRECANRATWAQDTNEEDIGGEVLKHFGVEE